MTEQEYIELIEKKLTEREIEPYLKVQLIETISELLNHYSVSFVQELLPSLLSQKNKKE